MILAIEIIEHIENPQQFLRECNSLLINGGYLILTTPNVCDFNSKRKWLFESEFYHFSPEAIHYTGHISILPYWLLEYFLISANFNIQKGYAWGKVGRAFYKDIILNSFYYFLGLLISKHRKFLTGDNIIITAMKNRLKI